MFSSLIHKFSGAGLNGEMIRYLPPYFERIGDYWLQLTLFTAIMLPVILVFSAILYLLFEKTAQKWKLKF